MEWKTPTSQKSHVNYSELLQLARFGVIFCNYWRVIIWRLRLKAREKGIPHTDVCIVISRQVQSGNYFDFGANCKWGWGDGIWWLYGYQLFKDDEKDAGIGDRGSQIIGTVRRKIKIMHGRFGGAIMIEVVVRRRWFGMLMLYDFTKEKRDGTILPLLTI